jgi:molybdopterin-biosynthesis enzyme MoeA-like protein
MKVFFYSSDDEVPFSAPYDNLNSQKSFIISNKDIEQFEKHKAQLMDLVGDEITDKVFFVPKEVKEIFLNWFKENESVNWSQKETVSKPVMADIIGEKKLNQFLKQMSVEEEWESVVTLSESNPTTLTEKKRLSDTKESKQQSLIQSLRLVWGILLIIIITVVFVFYYHGEEVKNDNGKLTITSSNGKNDNGKLTITTSFPDCDVYFNGEKQEQKTPVRKLPVPAGNNIQIKIIPPDNDVKMCATIDLSPNESKKIGDNSFKNCVSQ